MSNVLTIANKETESYLLVNNGKYWGVEWEEFGQKSYGIARYISDAKRFDVPEKPIDADNYKYQFKVRDFVDNAKFVKIVEKISHTIEFVEEMRK